MAVTPSLVGYARSSGTMIAGPATVFLNGTATIGHLVVAAAALDKTAGGTTTHDADYVSIGNIVGANTTALAGIRTADGTTADNSFTFNWATTTLYSAAICSFNFARTATAPVNATPANNVSIAAAGTSAAVSATAPAEAGLAVAVVTVDTATDTSNWGAAGSWPAEWTLAALGLGSVAHTGSTAVAILYRTFTSGESVSFTWTNQMSTADEHNIFLSLLGGTEVAVGPVVNVKSWLGAVTHDGIRINTVTPVGDTVRPRWSTDPTLAGATLGTQLTADANGVAKHTISGLTAGTLYYYAHDVNGTLSATRTFRTLPAAPGTPASFTFCLASCRRDSVDPNPITLDRIRERTPSFYLMTGDFHYQDDDTGGKAANDVVVARGMYDKIQGQGRVNALLETVPTVYCWSDHDGTGDYADGLDVGWPAISQAYRDRVPSYTLAAATGCNHTFAVGRVRFIVLDTRMFRSDWQAANSSAKTMLGATQKQWLKDTITATTEPLIFLVSDVPWPPGGNLDDHWGSYPDEQAELLAYFNANLGTRKLHVLSGDSHMVAIDDGTNGGGYGCWSVAPLASVLSSKGGQWSHGEFLIVSRQYGHVTVTDSGGPITATITGYRADTDAVLVNDLAQTATHTIQTQLTPQKARPASDVTATGWTPTPAGTLAAALDEAVASDTDYVQATGV